MNILVSGGCKNGKSSHAEYLAINNKTSKGKLFYIATMIPKDKEDIKRIEKHVDDRKDKGFETLEIMFDIKEVLNHCKQHDSILLDATTSLLANEMFKNGAYQKGSGIKVFHDMKLLLQKLDNIVIVSDTIYSNSEKFDNHTNSYIKNLAQIDKLCACYCEIVLEAVGGIFVPHKGEDLYEKIV